MVVLPAESNPLRLSQRAGLRSTLCFSSYSIKILISLSFKRAFRRIESIFSPSVGYRIGVGGR